MAVDARRGRSLPAAALPPRRDQWVVPNYHQVHSVLGTPYTRRVRVRKTRRERFIDEHGAPRHGASPPEAEWSVSIWDHHPGFIDKATFDANRERIRVTHAPRAPGRRRRPRGPRLLQGIAVSGRCGRELKVQYQGRRGHQSPAYHCASSILVEGRGSWCLRVGEARSTKQSPARCWPVTRRGEGRAQRSQALEQDHDAD